MLIDDAGSMRSDAPTKHGAPNLRAPSLRARLLFVALVALITATIARIKFDQYGGLPPDFTHWWVAARALLNGQNPYEVIRPGVPYAWFDSHFTYPSPAAVVTVPVA